MGYVVLGAGELRRAAECDLRNRKDAGFGRDTTGMGRALAAGDLRGAVHWWLYDHCFCCGNAHVRDVWDRGTRGGQEKRALGVGSKRGDRTRRVVRGALILLLTALHLSTFFAFRSPFSGAAALASANKSLTPRRQGRANYGVLALRNASVVLSGGVIEYTGLSAAALRADGAVNLEARGCMIAGNSVGVMLRDCACALVEACSMTDNDLGAFYVGEAAQGVTAVLRGNVVRGKRWFDEWRPGTCDDGTSDANSESFGDTLRRIAARYESGTEEPASRRQFDEVLPELSRPGLDDGDTLLEARLSGALLTEDIPAGGSAPLFAIAQADAGMLNSAVLEVGNKYPTRLDGGDIAQILDPAIGEEDQLVLRHRFCRAAGYPTGVVVQSFSESDRVQSVLSSGFGSNEATDNSDSR